MGLLLWIVFGALVGWVASMIVGRNSKQGWVGNIIVGIVGSFIGGWIGSGLTDFHSTDVTVSGFIWALVGAVILLVIYQIATGERRNPLNRL